jgi:hypothetical protein
VPDAAAFCIADCADFVHSLASDSNSVSCMRGSGAVSGVCDENAQCVPDASCVLQGPPIVSCDNRCALPEPQCEPGTPADVVTVNSLCATAGQTALCNAKQCIEGPDGSVEKVDECTGTGTCVTPAIGETCVFFGCNGDVCFESCTDDTQCVDTATCDLADNSCFRD